MMYIGVGLLNICFDKRGVERTRALADFTFKSLGKSTYIIEANFFNNTNVWQRLCAFLDSQRLNKSHIKIILANNISCFIYKYAYYII